LNWSDRCLFDVTGAYRRRHLRRHALRTILINANCREEMRRPIHCRVRRLVTAMSLANTITQSGNGAARRAQDPIGAASSSVVDDIKDLEEVPVRYRIYPAVLVVRDRRHH